MLQGNLSIELALAQPYQRSNHLEEPDLVQPGVGNKVCSTITTPSVEQPSHELDGLIGGSIVKEKPELDST